MYDIVYNYNSIRSFFNSYFWGGGGGILVFKCCIYYTLKSPLLTLFSSSMYWMCTRFTFCCVLHCFVPISKNSAFIQTQNFIHIKRTAHLITLLSTQCGNNRALTFTIISQFDIDNQIFTSDLVVNNASVGSGIPRSRC